MADTFDPYREALVVEFNTIWPAEFSDLSVSERARLEDVLHGDPSACPAIEYVRTHTGFCRTITVTQADLDRIRK